MSETDSRHQHGRNLQFLVLHLNVFVLFLRLFCLFAPHPFLRQQILEAHTRAGGCFLVPGRYRIAPPPEAPNATRCDLHSPPLWRRENGSLGNPAAPTFTDYTPQKTCGRAAVFILEHDGANPAARPSSEKGRKQGKKCFIIRGISHFTLPDLIYLSFGFHLTRTPAETKARSVVNCRRIGRHRR